MRRTVRAFATTDPVDGLASAISRLPEPARQALGDVSERRDLPLVSGTWEQGPSGCLVANVVRSLGGQADADATTLDLAVLELLPELSSRDVNRLVVAWDEAANALGARTDEGLRTLLREAIRRSAATVTPVHEERAEQAAGSAGGHHPPGLDHVR